MKDLTVHNMTFINNTGCGLLVINSGGVIEVSWSRFINNGIYNCTYSGGGMIIIIIIKCFTMPIQNTMIQND